MPAVTFKQAVNRVLVKLREDETSDLATADPYTKLIAAFVNEAKEDTENAWSWNSLLDEVTVTTEAGTSTYALTNVGQEFSIDSAFNSTNNVWMRGPMPNWKINQWQDISSNNGTPLWFDFFGTDASNDPNFRVWPTPDGVYTLKVWTRHRQAYLETSDDSDVVIKVPWKPVVFGAYYRAVSERGEDGGQIYDESVRAYELALSDAIALDAQLLQRTTDWHNEDIHLRDTGYVGLP